MDVSAEQHRATSLQGSRAGQGKFEFLPQQVSIQFEDGSGIIGPVGDVSIQKASVASDIKEIVDIICKFIPKVCGRGDGGGGGGDVGCYTIIGPDGTKITICPPKRQ